MELIWQWFVWFTLHRVTRYVASWLLAFGSVALVVWASWDVFDRRERPDGNNGHTTIDFAGQWMMGAMLARGHGRDLYDRRIQRQILEENFPYSDEIPDDKRENNPHGITRGERDAKNLMNWFMGQDDREAMGPLVAPLGAQNPFEAAALVQAGWQEKDLDRARGAWVGGPLYPPINAFYYLPLGLMDPHRGYRVNQVMCFVYAFIAGLGVSYMTRGRFWWPLASALIVIYPGFKGAVMLGQNPPLTLLFLIWGWALIVRDRPTAAGIVWGLLAFKPVWALAFFLVPFLTGRWRTCLAMLLTAGFLVVLTLPFVGFYSWYHWLHVGHMAAELYKTDRNWVFLSRDLLGIPRRLFIDFDLPSSQRNPPEATFWGWVLLGFVVGTTVLLTLARFRQAMKANTGPIAAFLLLAAWMSCFHFMYYDILLTALPMFVLMAEPRELIRPLFLAIVRVQPEELGDDLVSYYRPRLPHDHPPTLPLIQAGYRNLWVINRMVPNVLLLLLFIEHVQHKFPLNVYISGAFLGTDIDTTRKITTTLVQEGVLTTVTLTQTEGVRILTTTLWHGGQPWDTYVCLFLWMWCGFLWLRTPTRPKAPPWPGVPGADVLLLASGDKAAEPVELETHVRRGHE